MSKKTKKPTKHEEERFEALWRILVAIIDGFIFQFWLTFNGILACVNAIIALIVGERNKDIAELCEVGNTQFYVFMTYITGVSQTRPFPFGPLQKNLTAFEK